MSRTRRQNQQQRLLAENNRLRAKLLAAHDLLHNNKLNELHDVLHCESCEQAEEVLSGMNITVDTGNRLSLFASGFNRLCAEHRVMAAFTAWVPSAVTPGYTSIQMGGSVDVIQWLRREMGLKPTHAIGDH